MNLKFYNEWFGVHGGREVFYANRRSREYIKSPEQLETYVKECTNLQIPAYMSVQPYISRDRVFGLEKLYFDFDCEGKLDKAWRDAYTFSETLIKYYGVEPLILFSGCKGYNVYVFYGL